MTTQQPGSRAVPSAPTGDRALGQLLSALTSEFRTLVRQEIQLAKVETKETREELGRAGKAAGSLVGGGRSRRLRIGFLAAAVFPGTQPEGQLALKAQDLAQPVVEQVKQSGQGAVEALKEPAQQAAQQLKDTASVGEVRSAAQDAAGDTKEAASRAGGQVTDQAKQSGQTVMEG
jgi:hypothetical protein